MTGAAMMLARAAVVVAVLTVVAASAVLAVAVTVEVVAVVGVVGAAEVTDWGAEAPGCFIDDLAERRVKARSVPAREVATM
jgi:hypothetical protein